MDSARILLGDVQIEGTPLEMEDFLGVIRKFNELKALFHMRGVIWMPFLMRIVVVAMTC